ncbi:MAG: bifunctional DNA primase/polymerase [Minisyncoccia bacterium]
MLEWALDYRKRGWSVIPVNKDKIPHSGFPWKAYQTELPSEEEMRMWWKQWPNSNIAVITGKISGVVALDLDIKHGRKSSEFPIPPTAAARSGSGGEHFFFKYPQQGFKSAGGVSGNGVDIRGDGGYIVLSPSVNAKGGKYEWLVPPEEGISDVPEWLLKLSAAPVSEKKWLAGKDGVSAGLRNETAASMAGKLHNGMDAALWESLGWLTFKNWNTQNIPPLPALELRSIWESVERYHLKNAATNNNPDDKDKKKEPAIDLTTLLNTEFPAARFAVEQLIEAGTINMLAAPPNKWKSWVLLLISIRVASGTSLFGHFATAKQAVLIVNEEDNARLLQDRLRMMMEKEEDLPIYFHIDKAIKIEPKMVDQLILEAKEKNIGMIIFDSLRSVHDAEENSSQEMQVIMDQLKRITREGITVLFSHHNRKKMKSGGGKEDWDDSRGSTAINAAVHGHLGIDEAEGDDGSKYLIIMQHKLKAAAKIPPFSVQMEFTTDPDKIRFSYSGEHKAKERELGRARAAVFEVFEKSAVWLSVNDLLQMEIAAETSVRDALKMLNQQGHLQSHTLKNALRLGIPVQTSKGQHNTKVYFRAVETDQTMNEIFDALPEVASLPGVAP